MENAKPNISAPYKVTIPNMNSWSGTSFSTPIVTGIAAILESCKASYSTYPERTRAVLMSTSKQTYNYNSLLNYFDEKVGAGIVSMYDAIESYQYFYKNNSIPGPGATIFSEYISLDSGEEIQIALAWMISTTSSHQTLYITDYDIHLYHPNGSICAVSNFTYSNSELIRYTTTTAGTYRIVLYLYGTVNQNIIGDWIALTYRIVGDDTGHVHCYEGAYTPIDENKHKRECYCGESYTESYHVWLALGNGEYECFYCGYHQ